MSERKLIRCAERLPEKSGEYNISNNSGCNNGEARMYYSPETGWDVPEELKSTYLVIGWYEPTA